MATYTTKPNGKTKAEVVRQGHPRVSKVFGTKKAAEQWAIAKEAELLGTNIAVAEKTSLRHAIERYRDRVAPTRKGGDWEVKRCNKFLGVRNKRSHRYPPRPLPFIDKRCSEVTPDEIAIWRDHCLAPIKEGGFGLKPESVLRELGLLQTIFEYARKEWRYCRTNPVRDVSKKGLKQKGRKKTIPQAHIDAVVAELGFVEGQKPVTKKQEVAIEFLIALETAMRDSEILTGEKEDLHLKKRYVHLDKSKNGDERDVPLSSRAVELYKLMAGRSDGPKIFTLDSATRDALFRKAVQAAEVPHFTFHQSRHTAITRLAKKLAILDLAKMVGHRDLKSLMVYYNADAEALARQLD